MFYQHAFKLKKKLPFTFCSPNNDTSQLSAKRYNPQHKVIFLSPFDSCKLTELSASNLPLNSSCPLHFAKALISVLTHLASAVDRKDLVCLFRKNLPNCREIQNFARYISDIHTYIHTYLKRNCAWLESNC